jgi:hypothetical protein
MVKLCTRFMGFILLLSALVSSCQKDENVTTASTALKTDSAKILNVISGPGNYLATKGTLKIKLHDSTYTFDATKDSIAFVNINIDGEKYFGLTAINKDHTVSFGISSSGAAVADTTGAVSGCQFLLHPAGKLNQEFTLTHNTSQKDYGTIGLEKYNQDTVLAKGTFHTYLAKDIKTNTFLVADGSFELKVK